MVGTGPVFSRTLLVGVTSALLSGVVFLAWVDNGSATASAMEWTTLLMLLLVGPLELLRPWVKEEFILPERRYETCITPHSDLVMTARSRLTGYQPGVSWLFRYHSAVCWFVIRLKYLIS